ncbi:MAG: hypothetical protein KGL21_08485, partial [Alphaproteobacteria bacterium]|nr:hypothetical protein [Alphaproteobacteria bacterium]
MRDTREKSSLSLANPFDRRWVALTALVWLGTAIVMVIIRWGMIRWMNMGDMNDDTMRLLQVRA